jgi:hypothetical protein
LAALRAAKDEESSNFAWFKEVSEGQKASKAGKIGDLESRA